MARMGKYCKAYSLRDFRRYPRWTERTENARVTEGTGDGTERKAAGELPDDAYLFLQENYVVTDGIFLDEHVIFDAVNDDWKNFCTQELGFEIPKRHTAPGGEKTESS